jgi:SH3 domain-containing YSC84-like protein 1
MRSRNLPNFILAVSLALAAAVPAGAQGKGRLKAPAGQSKKAAQVFREIMQSPDKGIPHDLLGQAACVAVFPSVIKGGFIVGARYGRGVASCRTASGWSAPAFFDLEGGSFGLQIGAQATDLVMLFMNEGGMKSLLSDRFELGGDASVAAGPVGRQVGAGTDLKLDAQILSYSRSRGLFAGLELKGAVIRPDKKDMEDAYGPSVTAGEVLRGGIKAARPLLVFPLTINHYVTPGKK